MSALSLFHGIIQRFTFVKLSLLFQTLGCTVFFLRLWGPASIKIFHG
jgi:hypothetical protein